MWRRRLWKTIRSRDEALIMGICALIDPKHLPGPLPWEGTGQVSMTGNLALTSILALPGSRAVSKGVFDGEPTYVLCYGGSNGRRQLAFTSAPTGPAQVCKVLANDPNSLAGQRSEAHLAEPSWPQVLLIRTVFVGLMVSCKSEKWLFNCGSHHHGTNEFHTERKQTVASLKVCVPHCWAVLMTGD